MNIKLYHQLQMTTTKQMTCLDLVHVVLGTLLKSVLPSVRHFCVRSSGIFTVTRRQGLIVLHTMYMHLVCAVIDGVY